MTQNPNPKSLREAQPILVIDDSLDDFEATKRAFRVRDRSQCSLRPRASETP